MEKLKHTPEPWTLKKTWSYMDYYEIHGADDIGVLGEDDSHHEFSILEPNAKRIVDCVNAMTGIENPSEFIENLKQKNIELLQLLESIEVMLSQGNFIRPQSFIIRNAIQIALGIENKKSNTKTETK